jgi:hypothetical protein
MTYDEYKERWQNIQDDTAFASLCSYYFKHPLFNSLLEDENAKAYCYGLLAYEELSWVTLSLAARLWPDINVPEEHYGVATKLRIDYLNWIESHS